MMAGVLLTKQVNLSPKKSIKMLVTLLMVWQQLNKNQQDFFKTKVNGGILMKRGN